MVNYLKKYSLTYHRKIITILLLTSILSIIGGMTSFKNAWADSPYLILTKNQPTLLPTSIQQAIRRDVAKKEGIYRKIQIIDYQPKIWRDSCLELSQPNELCTQALVPGWRVVVNHNQEKWIYHTNSDGRSVRLAAINTPTDNPNPKLPKSVKNAVLQAASQHLQTPILQIKLTQAEPQTWNDGCLNLATPDEFCTQALVPGWRITVSQANQSLVYHTNATGSVVRLNKKASSLSSSSSYR